MPNEKKQQEDPSVEMSDARSGERSGVPSDGRLDEGPVAQHDRRPEARPKARRDQQPTDQPDKRPDDEQNKRPDDRPGAHTDERPNEKPGERLDNRPNNRRPNNRRPNNRRPDNRRPDSKPDNRRSDNRAALIDAAIRLFGEKGYSATSTREIAQAANANIALISYHFDGKQGLYEACADTIIERAGAFAGRLVLTADPGGDQQRAAEILEQALAGMVRFLVLADHSGEFVGFMVRELGGGGRSIDRIYEGLLEPVHKAACKLWATATGMDAGSRQTRLAVFAVIGQVVYFRLARPVIARRLGWTDIGEAEAAAITAAVTSGLRANIAAARKSTAGQAAFETLDAG